MARPCFLPPGGARSMTAILRGSRPCLEALIPAFGPLPFHLFPALLDQGLH